MAGKSAGSIFINLSAGTSQFILDMEKANAKIRDFGAGAGNVGNAFKQMGDHSVSGVQATSGALRVLEGGITNNLRAAERFTANVLGLGPILQAAFPVIGAIAFAGIITKLGEEASKFYTGMRDGPAKIGAAFRELNQPIKLANDEMQVSNDRLQNEIAKLEGKRQNTLKLALDESVVAADKLADSLEKDLDKLNKLLEEKNLGGFKAFFTGQGATTDIKEQFGGLSGQGGLTGDIADIASKGQARIDSAKQANDLKAAEAASTELNTALLKRYGQELDVINKKLAEAREAAKPSIDPLVGPVEGQDMRARIEELLGARRLLEGEMRKVPLIADNTALTAKRDALQAKASNADLGRPFEDRLAKLRADLSDVTGKLNAAGLSEGAKLIANAEGAAVKAIEEVNAALKKRHTQLTDSQKEQIRGVELSIANATAEEQWRTKLAQTTAQIRDQIAGQELLTAAIGKGYAAVKNANVETKLMSSVGAEKYNDPDWMKSHHGDVTGLRDQISAEYEAHHADQIAQSMDQLRDQIALETRLAQVQIQGAEAVRLATLQVKLAKMEENGATKEQLDAELALYRAQRANAAAAEIAGINEKIAATNRLSDAMVKGAEAERKAVLENKYIGMQRAGAPEVIGQQRVLDDSEHQQKVRGDALKSGNIYQDRLQSIKAELLALDEIQSVEGKTFETEVSRRNLENERLKTILEQYVALRNIRDENLKLLADLAREGGTARDGVRAFFIEMQTQAKTTAAIVEETLNSALDRVSTNLAKGLTGQKANWGQTFQDLGQGLLKDTIKSDLQKTLGSIGQHFGISGLGGKPDGTRSNPIWVQQAGPGGAVPAIPGIPNILGGKTGGIFGGSAGGGIFNLLGSGGGQSSGGGGIFSKLLGFGLKALPFLAEGGDVSAGSSYLVGERGPELFTAAASGSITSNSRTSAMGLGGHHIHIGSIDARGTDPHQIYQNVYAAMRAQHAESVGTSVQVHHDQMRRTPAGRP